VLISRGSEKKINLLRERTDPAVSEQEICISNITMIAMAKVSIIIKVLNEECNIDRAVESALEAVAPFGGDVIVADSGSTDRTIEKAMKFPITIVQLDNPSERSCGIGAQLGYQHSSGEYVYILDGDMKLDAMFLAQAIEFMDREPSVAGVAGILREMQIHNLEFLGRARRLRRRLQKQASDVLALDGGGLYRRAAVEQVSYFSDRNLHGYEEYDLGARLRVRGWRLVRLATHAIDHYGHTTNSFRLLWYRILSGYLMSTGEILRAAIVSRYVKNVLFELRGLRIALGVWLYWGVVAVIIYWIPSSLWALLSLLLALALPPAAMALRTQSLKLGIYSAVLWHVNAIGLIFGVARRRTAATKRIESRILRFAGD
jgi:GT2 family glycosyltransferase